MVGQVVGREPEVLNSVSIALFDIRTGSVHDWKKAAVLLGEKIFSILFSTRDLLDSGDWKVIDVRPVSIPQEMLPYEKLRSQGFVGAKVIGSGIVNSFVNAFSGLAPWDDWKDPHYLDTLLLTPDKKPSHVICVRSPK